MSLSSTKLQMPNNKINEGTKNATKLLGLKAKDLNVT